MRSLLTDMLHSQLATISDGTLNRRLYRAIRQGILEGVLRAGSRLPATRDLAQQLAMSRNTVSAAYDQLQAEGYLYTRTGSGTFVTAHLPDGAMTTVYPPAPAAAQQRALTLSKRGTTLLHSAGASPHQWGAFMPGVPDIASFPHAVWRRIQARVIKRIAPHALTYSPLGGSPARPCARRWWIICALPGRWCAVPSKSSLPRVRIRLSICWQKCCVIPAIACGWRSRAIGASAMYWRSTA